VTRRIAVTNLRHRSTRTRKGDAQGKGSDRPTPGSGVQALPVVEQLLDPDPQRGRPTAYLPDIQMMAMLPAAGFRAVRVM